MNDSNQEDMVERWRLDVRGAVQGVGFRPHVYRVARDIGLPGWVLNSPTGVTIEVEGETVELELFISRLVSERPPLCTIHSLDRTTLEPAVFTSFEIRESTSSSYPETLVLPDIATCADCLTEIFDPTNRRHLYPFTNCTNCGPRYSIVESLPYDRSNTTMKAFTMCPECSREYHDPTDRRFHAQPNACPACGPHVELWNRDGQMIDQESSAIDRAVEIITEGGILALKGIGGFHLIVDARNDQAVARLRRSKRREEKTLAVMYPSIEQVYADCSVSPTKKEILLSPEAPIMLLERRPIDLLSPAVALGSPYFGVMLPYSPLHHILMRRIGGPVVATRSPSE